MIRAVFCAVLALAASTQGRGDSTIPSGWVLKPEDGKGVGARHSAHD